jgi:hypothetical protein
VSDTETELRTVHAAPDGRLLIVESLVGDIYPPIPGYVYLGQPADVFAMLGYHVRQSVLAEMFGVTQQSISRYASGLSEPWSLKTWAPVIRLVFEVCLSQPDHEHTVDLYRANVLRPAHVGRKRKTVPTSG